MQIPPLAPCVCGFAQKDGAAVSQLRHIDAELMARIEHGKRLHARREHAAPEEGGKFRPFGLVGSEIDEICSGGVETDQIRRRGEWSGVQLRVESIREPGIGVVERESFKMAIAHGHQDARANGRLSSVAVTLPKET